MGTMRAGFLMLTLVLAFGLTACSRSQLGSLTAGRQEFASFSNVSNAKKPDFESEIKPIFQARCQPCHFQGGKVYDKMPFDKPETIHRLGAKLFTRIKDEKERRMISEFLAQP
jgi:hypothetical protein